MRLKLLMAIAFVALAAAATPPFVLAQAGGADNQQPASAHEFVARWNNGLELQSDNADYRLQFGALIQTDGRFSLDDPLQAVTDSLFIRRARPIVQGRVAKYFDFRLVPDFAGGNLVLFDAYMDTRLSNGFRIRVGKDKTPIGLEQLQANYAVIFPERTLATNLVPNRDVGIQILGDLANGTLSYIGAIFNGVPDAANGDVDANSGKDAVARLTIRPFSRTSNPLLSGLGIAIAGSSGRQEGALPSFKSEAQQTFFAYATNASADGVRTRLSPSAFYYYKAFGAFGEYVVSKQTVKRGSTRAEVTNQAWEITALVVTTGEPATDHGVTPRAPFDPARRAWGALQLAIRYSALAVDPQAFALGLANAGTSRQARALGVGATWYANAYVKEVLSFERTVFDGNPDGPRKAENAIVFRVQMNLQPSL